MFVERKKEKINGGWRMEGKKENGVWEADTLSKKTRVISSSIADSVYYPLKKRQEITKLTFINI